MSGRGRLGEGSSKFKVHADFTVDIHSVIQRISDGARDTV